MIVLSSIFPIGLFVFIAMKSPRKIKEYKENKVNLLIYLWQHICIICLWCVANTCFFIIFVKPSCKPRNVMEGYGTHFYHCYKLHEEIAQEQPVNKTQKICCH